MKKLLQSFLAFSLFGSALNAETRVVLTGASIQEQIDAAVDGDIIAIFGGTYAQDVVINKKVRLVELAGQDVHITGNLTFDSVEDCPPLEGFKVGSASKGIVIDGVGSTTGLVIKDVETPGDSAGIVIGANSNEVSVIGGNHRSISQRGGNLTLNSLTVSSIETKVNTETTVCFRVNVGGTFTAEGENSKLWFAYGSASAFDLKGSNNTRVVIGSTIERKVNAGTSIYLRGSSNFTTFRNNLVHGLDGNYRLIYSDEREGRALIQNNYFSQNGRTWSAGEECIRIDHSTDYHVIGNIWNYYNTYNSGGDPVTMIRGKFGNTVKNNAVLSPATFVQSRFRQTNGGATSTDFLMTSGELSDLFADDDLRSLSVESPLINMGDPDPRMNDIDGSRNDIGPMGGPWYDPEGWTTENPVVISFDLSPDQALGGVNTEVEISEIQAISAP